MVTCLSTEACECHYQMLPIPVLRWALSFQIDRNTRHRETLNARRIHSTNDKELTDHAWFRSPCFCTMKNLPPLLWGCNAPAIPLYKKMSGAWNLCSCFSDQIWLRIDHVCHINIITWLQDLDTKKTTPNIEVCPESLGTMLEYWYIERVLFPWH